MKPRRVRGVVAPLLDDELTTSIQNALIMFSKKGEWKRLGMDKLRQQGACMLFYGEPGTGKTITARYVCRMLKLTMHEVDFGMVGSDTPGALARNIQTIFKQAIELDVGGNPSFVFLDECDTMLIDRTRLGHGSMWMLEPINALLREVGEYPGLIVLATNQKPDFLDFALERRLIGKFYFGMPKYQTRVKLWQSKWPRKLPCKLTIRDAERYAMYQLTGAEIEKMIILWVSNTLRREVEFRLEDFTELLRTTHNDRAEQIIHSNLA